MKTKEQLRKKYLAFRKKRYFDVSNDKFNPLINYINRKYYKKKKILIALYYPSNYEVDVLKIFNNLKKTKFKFLLPKILDGDFLNLKSGMKEIFY